MELLLHYCWNHKLFPLTKLTTTDGKSVEVIDPGLHNMDAGPDFFNAKIKIGGTLWVGNVEIHDKASDWFMHHHDADPRYDNVILHVCSIMDDQAKTCNGNEPSQMQLGVPEDIKTNYQQLLNEDKYPPCYKVIPEMKKIILHSWMSALQVERLEQKTEAIKKRVLLCEDSWEAGLFVTLARNFGFGKNNDAFEQWALRIPLGSIGHHRDNPFQIEALFLGQAGLLDINSVHQRYRDTVSSDAYFVKLRNEYKYLAHKFGLKPMDSSRWNFLRMHPQNFPYIRISQLADLYCSNKLNISVLVDCKNVRDSQMLLQAKVSEYWQTHYSFGIESPKNEKKLSPSSLNILIINTVIPVLFAYGRHREDQRLCDLAFDFLEQLKTEDNNIVRMWQQCGLDATTAGDSQALIQLKKEYCDKKDCLRCRIGYEYLKRK